MQIRTAEFRTLLWLPGPLAAHLSTSAGAHTPVPLESLEYPRRSSSPRCGIFTYCSFLLPFSAPSSYPQTFAWLGRFHNSDSISQVPSHKSPFLTSCHPLFLSLLGLTTVSMNNLTHSLAGGLPASPDQCCAPECSVVNGDVLPVIYSGQDPCVALEHLNGDRVTKELNFSSYLTKFKSPPSSYHTAGDGGLGPI